MSFLSVVEPEQEETKSFGLWQFTLEDVANHRYISPKNPALDCIDVSELMRAFELNVWGRFLKMIMDGKESKGGTVDEVVFEESTNLISVIFFDTFCYWLANLLDTNDQNIEIQDWIWALSTDEFYYAMLGKLDKMTYGQFAKGSWPNSAMQFELKMQERRKIQVVQ